MLFTHKHKGVRRREPDGLLPERLTLTECVPRFSLGIERLGSSAKRREEIERALEDDHLSRDPSPSKRASYIRRTMTKARDWADR